MSTSRVDGYFVSTIHQKEMVKICLNEMCHLSQFQMSIIIGVSKHAFVCFFKIHERQASRDKPKNRKPKAFSEMQYDTKQDFAMCDWINRAYMGRVYKGNGKQVSVIRKNLFNSDFWMQLSKQQIIFLPLIILMIIVGEIYQCWKLSPIY